MDIYKLLSNIGIEIPEDKKADFEKNFKENFKTNAEVEKIATARDNYKTQLETAQTALKEFDGIDIKEMQGKIATLTADLETKQNEYNAKIADMEFNNILDNALSKIGAKNSKAVKALLDIDTLKTSKNQADDINKALEQVKTDNDYMFTSDEPIKNVVHSTENSTITGGSVDLLRSAMGLSPENKN